MTAVSALAQKTDAYNNPILINNIELLRRGKQISVRLLTNKAPDYEITENLAARTLVLKIKNASAVFKDGRLERLFNDSQLAGIRFLAIDGDSWAQFKLLQKDLSYSVSSLEKNNGVQIDFRPTFQVQPLPDPLEDSVYELSDVDFEALVSYLCDLMAVV